MIELIINVSFDFRLVRNIGSALDYNPSILAASPAFKRKLILLAILLRLLSLEK